MAERVERNGDSELRVETITVTDEYSRVRIALNGINRVSLNRVSTTLYHVLSGTGIMNVNGVVGELYPGTIVEVPPNTPYFDVSDDILEMDAVSIPPFDPADVEYLD